MKARLGKPELAAAQVMQKASLADYLTDGLAVLERHHLDVDALLAAPVGSSN